MAWGKNSHSLYLLGIGLGAAAWLLDAFVDAFFLGGGSLQTQLLHPAAPETWMRIFIMVLFVIFSVIAGRLSSRRHGAEQQLKESHQLWDRVLDSIPDAVAVIDVRDFRIVSANARYVSDVGESSDAVLGRCCYEVAHGSIRPCGPPELSCPLMETLATGRLAVAEHLHYGATGEEHCEEVSTLPLLDETGAIIKVIHISRDISRRKEAETAMQRSENLYRTIFENTGTAMVIIAKSGLITRANLEFARLSGVSRGIVEQHKRWEYFFVEEEHSRIREYLQSSDEQQKYLESSFVGIDGELREVRLTVARIPDTCSAIMAILDVTESNRAEAALRNSEANLAKAQQIAHIGSWEWELAVDKISWSTEVYRIMGFPPEAITPTYELFISLVHPADREMVNRSINEALYSQKLFDLEHRIILSNLAERLVHQQGEVVYDAAGLPLRMVGTVSDISDRKRVEQALKLSEEKFYKAFNNSPDWMTLSRAADGLYIEVNDTFLEITGYSRDEVIGRTSLGLGIWSNPEVRSRMLKLLDEFGRIRNYEISIRTKEGEMRIMRWSADIMEYNGEACLIATARDITEQKQLEQEVLASQAQLYRKHEELKRLFADLESDRMEWVRTIDCLGDMVVLADGEGRIKRCNQAFLEFVGLDRQAALGREWGALFVEQQLVSNAIFDQGIELQHEPTGRWYVFSTYPFQNKELGSVSGTVIIMHDITELKQVSTQLALVSRQLHEGSDDCRLKVVGDS